MAHETLCAVGGCNKIIVNRRGYCSSHYRRLLRHGDPLKGNAAHGSGKRWLVEHKDHSGLECLQWPFSKTGVGYGLVRVQPGNPSMQTASRYMCELANGPPPFEWYQAAHSCGDRGCVNPKHLSWKTPTDNLLDRREHGTFPQGSRNPNSKLSAADVSYILSMKGMVVQQRLAEMFGVSHGTISRIMSGQRSI